MGKLINTILNLLSKAVKVILVLLPDSPFQKIQLGDGVKSFLGVINWVVPVGEIVTFLSLYIVAVSTWYGVRWILRFTKYIQ